MKKSSYFFLPLMVLITVFGIIWTQDLDQANKETIFLTEESQAEYKKFQADYNIRSLVVAKIKTENRKDVLTILNQVCNNLCQILDKDSLPKNPKIRFTAGREEALILLQSEQSDDLDFKNVLKKILLNPMSKEMDFSGVPYTNVLLDEYSKKVKTVIFPSLFAGVFLLLLIYLRSLIYSIVVFFPGLMAASLSLASTKFFFEKSNLITSIIPLLLFVIQMSLVLHIHFTGKELKSLELALRDKREPVFLMVFTTFIGFGSLYFSELKAISDFGIMTSFLLLASTLFSCLWLWLLSMGFEFLWNQEEKVRAFPFENRLGLFWSFKKICLFSFLVLLIGGFSLTKIPIITDATQYFPKETKIREKMITLSQKFIGSPLVEIVIPHLRKEKAFDHLKEIFEKESILTEKLPGLILSSNQLVKLGNEAYTGEDGFPGNRFAYFALRSKVPEAFKEGYPVEEDRGYRMTYLGAPMNVDEYELILSEFKKVFGEEAQFNGLYFHLMEAQKKMIGTLFKSFSLSLFLISLVAFIYFKRIKLFFIFMAVNILPVFASFPVFWLLGLSFNIATVMTYSISLGLVVDSSFHIIHTLNDSGKDRDFLVKSVLQPIVGASILLSICFLFFALIDFLPIKEFGLSLGVVIFFGMVLDLKVLPALHK